jgi:hypothetical protein
VSVDISVSFLCSTSKEGRRRRGEKSHPFPSLYCPIPCHSSFLTASPDVSMRGDRRGSLLPKLETLPSEASEGGSDVERSHGRLRHPAEFDDGDASGGEEGRAVCCCCCCYEEGREEERDAEEEGWKHAELYLIAVRKAKVFAHPRPDRTLFPSRSVRSSFPLPTTTI